MIWGATHRITRNLLDVLARSELPHDECAR